MKIPHDNPALVHTVMDDFEDSSYFDFEDPHFQEYISDKIHDMSAYISTFLSHPDALSVLEDSPTGRLLAYKAWEQGYKSGTSRTMRYMSDEPNVLPAVNPYEVAPTDET